MANLDKNRQRTHRSRQCSGEAVRAFAPGDTRTDRPRICLGKQPREAVRQVNTQLVLSMLQRVAAAVRRCAAGVLAPRRRGRRALHRWRGPAHLALTQRCEPRCACTTPYPYCMPRNTCRYITYRSTAGVRRAEVFARAVHQPE